MTASVTNNPAANPRGVRDLGRSLDKRQPDYNDILEDQTRVTFYDLEGDMPTPSSLAPDRGVRQYFYTGNYAAIQGQVERHLTQPQWRGPYGSVEEDLGIQNSDQTVNFRYSYTITVPNNNTWYAVYDLDDRKRDIQGERAEYSYTISRASWDTTDGVVLTAEDQPLTTGTIPITLYLTTSPYYALNPQYKFVPPGSTITVEFEVLEQTDDAYISVSASDLEWEQGVDNLGGTIKPQERFRTEVRARQLFHNQQINEEPFNDSRFYDSIRLPVVYNYLPRYKAIETSISFTLGSRETADENAAKARNTIGIGNNYADAFPGQVWYEQQPDPKHFWSALYVNYVLYQSGIAALRTQSALDYATYGQEVDWRNWENVRKYDIVVFKFKEHSGGHVGFITEFDPATNRVKVVGGNQLNRAKESLYLVENANMYILTVRRSWPDPGKEFGIIQG